MDERESGCLALMLTMLVTMRFNQMSTFFCTWVLKVWTPTMLTKSSNSLLSAQVDVECGTIGSIDKCTWCSGCSVCFLCKWQKVPNASK